MQGGVDGGDARPPVTGGRVRGRPAGTAHVRNLPVWVSLLLERRLVALVLPRAAVDLLAAPGYQHDGAGGDQGPLRRAFVTEDVAAKAAVMAAAQLIELARALGAAGEGVVGRPGARESGHGVVGIHRRGGSKVRGHAGGCGTVSRRERPVYVYAESRFFPPYSFPVALSRRCAGVNASSQRRSVISSLLRLDDRGTIM